MMSQPARLAIVERSGKTESEHWGWLVVADASGAILHRLGEPGRKTFWRSCAKPLQALASLETGAAEAFGWSADELALVCASHSATPAHVEIARAILAKAAIDPELLGCGPHLPLGDAAREALLRSGEPPTKLHNNCSGKHAGMLAACKQAGWDLATYLEERHPLQRAAAQAIVRFAGLAAPPPAGVDGCGLPTYFTSLDAAAIAFARLANPEVLPENDARHARRIVAAMTARPDLVAGEGRLDTLLMELAEGAIVSKCGAEGQQCFGLIGRGVGVAIKNLDGAPRAHAAIVAEIGRAFLPELEWDRFLVDANPPICNTRGEEVGWIRAAFAPPESIAR
ncbi:MAG TPA: asparaginase [Planctomycetia bacterium]|nr:asparaginase [Planctomycetia bacterium]